MSHQISFYMMSTDLQCALKSILNCGDYVILHSRSHNSKPRILSKVEFEEDEKTWLYYYLARPEDVLSIKMEEVSTQGYWSIDSLYAPVVELHCCAFDNSTIRQGRLYFEDRYYDDKGQKVVKPEPYVRWANCVLATMKKNLKRDSSRDAYVGSEVLTWARDCGGILLI
ncbi:MAG: hypothetical protein WCI73_18925 [Phycisphaerae bacterium]